MQCERIRKLISRWHRDELGAERKAARRKCSKALAPILDVIRKNAVHASVKAVGASRNAPHNAAPSLPHLEASRTVLDFAAAVRGQGTPRRSGTDEGGGARRFSDFADGGAWRGSVHKFASSSAPPKSRLIR